VGYQLITSVRATVGFLISMSCEFGCERRENIKCELRKKRIPSLQYSQVDKYISGVYRVRVLRVLRRAGLRQVLGLINPRSSACVAFVAFIARVLEGSTLRILKYTITSEL